MKNRQLLAAGAILWILGLGMTIAGLNIPGDAGKWIGVIGNILFLIGLMLEGICWFRAKRNAEDAEEEKRTEGKDDPASQADTGAESEPEAPAEKAPGGSGEKTKEK